MRMYLTICLMAPMRCKGCMITNSSRPDLLKYTTSDVSLSHSSCRREREGHREVICMTERGREISETRYGGRGEVGGEREKQRQK